jgi:hypothetical protein
MKRFKQYAITAYVVSMVILTQAAIAFADGGGDGGGGW